MNTMKYAMLICIIFTLLSGRIYSNSSVFTTEDVTGIVTNACSSTSTEGAIDLTIHGGTGPYNVKWYRSATIPVFPIVKLPFILKESNVPSNNGQEDLIGIGPGHYTVYITDSNCGRVILEFNVEGKFNILHQSDLYKCNNGTVTIIPKTEGGVLPFQYMWSNGQTGASASNLSAGRYTVTITDQTGCKVFKEYKVKNSQIKYNLRTKPKSCDNDDVAFIKIKNLSGGESPYTVQWSNGQRGTTNLNLGAGTYSFTITDHAGCSSTGQTSIGIKNSGIRPPEIRNSQNCLCDGSIRVSFYGTTHGSGTWYKGGTLYRSIEFNNDQSIYNLCPDRYNFVSENYGCPIDEVFIVEEEPCTTQIQLVDLKNSCGCGTGSQCDGFVTISISNPPLGFATIKWYKDNVLYGQGEYIRNLCPGDYRAEYYNATIQQTIVRNFKIENIDCSPEIDQQVKLNQLKNASDCNIFDGFIDLSSTNPNLQYHWNTGATTQDISNLSEGTYTVTVTALPCKERIYTYTICTCSDCYDVTEGWYATYTPSTCALNEYISEGKNVSSLGANDGKITLTLKYPSLYARYRWIGPNGFYATSQNISNLSLGKYTLEFDNGCTITSEDFYIIDTDLCKANPIKIAYDKVCLTAKYLGNGELVKNSVKPGKISLKISGGTEPYSFKWNTGATSKNIDVNTAGTYIVTVTDQNRCTAVSYFYMEQANYFIGHSGSTNPELHLLEYPLGTYRLCDENSATSDGANVVIRIMGGVSPVKVKWHDGVVDQVFLTLTDPITGLKWAQVSRFFSGLDATRPFRWEASVTDGCFCGDENIGQTSTCRVGRSTISGKLACKTTDTAGNTKPCEILIETKNLRGQFCDPCDKWWQGIDWELSCDPKPTFKNINKDRNIHYDLTFFPYSTRSTIFHDQSVKFVIPEPGVFYVLAEEVKGEINPVLTGCRQSYRIDFTDVCEDKGEDVIEPNVNGGECPFIGEPVVENDDSDIIKISFDISNIPDIGTNGKLVIRKNLGGKVVYSEDINFTNGTYIQEFDKKVLEYESGNKTYSFEIIFPELGISCSKPIQLLIQINDSDANCAENFQIVFDESTSQGIIKLFSPATISGCQILLPGNVTLNRDLVKGKNEIPFTISNMSPGTYTIVVKFPDSQQCKSISKKITFIGQPCLNNFEINANSASKSLNIIINSNVNIPNCIIKFIRNQSVRKEKTFEIKTGNQSYDFNEVMKSLPAGDYTIEIILGNLGCPKLTGTFQITEPEKLCKVQYKNKDVGKGIDGLYIRYEWSKPYNTEISGFYKLVDASNKLISNRAFSLIKENANGILYAGPFTGLSAGGYTFQLFHDESTGCPPENFSFNVSGIKDNDPPASFMTCNDNIISVIYDPVADDYKFFWGKSNEEASLLLGHQFKTLNTEQDIANYVALNYDTEDIKHIAIDPAKNLTLTKVSSSGAIELNKFNPFTHKLWTAMIENKNYISQTEGLSGMQNILVFDSLSNHYQKISISAQGSVAAEENLNLEIAPYAHLKLVSDAVMSIKYNEKGAIFTWHPNGGAPRSIKFDKGIRFKDIKLTGNGNVVLAGEYKGEIKIDNVSYNSEGFNNVLFIQLDNALNILKVKSEQNYRDEYIGTFDTDGQEDISYAGKFVTKDFIPNDAFPLSSDSCTYIHLIKWDENCIAKRPALLLDSTLCMLRLDTIVAEAKYVLQIYWLGQWVTIPEVTFPHAPSKNGTYRVILITKNCPYLYSEPVVIHCTGHLDPCPVVRNIDVNFDTYCYTMEITSDSIVSVDITFTHWGGHNESVIVKTETQPYILNPGTNLVNYCGLREDDPDYYWHDLTYDLHCVSCGCNLSGYMLRRYRPVVNNGSVRDSISKSSTETRVEMKQAVRFYPNPFTKGITMDIIAEQSETVTLETYNNLGALMFSIKENLQSGPNIRYIDAFSQLPTGVYTIKVNTSTVEFVSRVIRVE